MAKGKGRSKVLPIILAILAIAVVAANIAAVMFDSTLDKYAPGGGNPVSVKVAEGSEDWDTAYYTTEYRGRVLATQAAEEMVAEVEGEEEVEVVSIFAPEGQESNAELDKQIEDLDLSVRSYNCLKRAGIHSVRQLVEFSENDLLNIRNFGAKSIEEVKDKLISMGLNLKL